MGPKPKAPTDECVRVVVRARPFNKREKDMKCTDVLDIDIEADTVRIQKPETNTEADQRAFVFDAVYNEHSTQRVVYDETASPLVESVLAGYNGTIFAYGQTGCGKTWSMEGMEEPKELRGIIPNAFDHIFDVVDADESDRQYLIRASYLEIYNEEVRDLLGDDPVKKCDLHESPNKGVYVKGLTTGIVKTSGEIDGLMKAGNKNRSVGATLMNAVSSRSHSIFQVTIETSEEKKDSKGKKSQSIKVGKLNLVDLAGSERQSKTEAKGERFKEATKINLSLSALGNVINALVAGKSQHIPYRDSKLTRLLQDSLGGNTKTVMLAAISPADNNYDETMSTLRYANRAKNIKNKPKINEDPKDALLREFQEEIERLRQMLEAQQQGLPMPVEAAKDKSPIKRVQSKPQLDKQGSMAFLDSAKGKELIEKESSLVRTAKEIEDEQAKLREKEELLQRQQTEMADKEKAVLDEKARVAEKEAEMKRKEEELARQNAALAHESEEMAKKIAQAVKEKDEAAKKELEEQLAELNAEKEALANATQEAEKEKGSLENQLADMQSMVHSRGQAAEEAAARALAAEKAAAAAKRNEARERRRAQIKLEKQKAREELLRNEMEYLEQDKELEKEEAAYLEDQAEMNEQLIKRLKKKYLVQKGDIADLKEEYQNEREYLTGQLRDQAREMSLLEQIVSLFVPPKILQRIEARAKYDEDNDEWVIPQDLIRDRPAVQQAALKLPGMDPRAASAPRQRRGSFALDAALRAADHADPGGVKLSEMGGLEQMSGVAMAVIPSQGSPDEEDGRSSQNSVKGGARPASGARRPLGATATATPPHLRYLQEVEGRKRSASTVMAEGPTLTVPKGPPTKNPGKLGQVRTASAIRTRSDLNGSMTPSLPGLGPTKGSKEGEDAQVPAEDAHVPKKRSSGSSGARDSPFVPINDGPPGAPVKAKRKEKKDHHKRHVKATANAEEEAYLEEGFEEEVVDPEEQAYLEEGFEDDPEAKKVPGPGKAKGHKSSSGKRESHSRSSKRHSGEKKPKSKKPASVPGLNLSKAALDKQSPKIPAVKGTKKGKK